VTNPVATIAVTFGGTDVQAADFGVFLEIVKGLNESPEVRGSDLVVPGLPGRVPRNRVGDRLAIELLGMVSGSGATRALLLADFRANVRAVQALFAPTAAPAVLAAALEDGTTATILARPLNLVWRDVAPGIAVVSVEMESAGSPYWTVT